MNTDERAEVSAQSVAQAGEKAGDIVWQRIVHALSMRLVRLSSGDERLQFMCHSSKDEKWIKKRAALREDGLCQKYVHKGCFSALTEQELALKVVCKHWRGNITQHYVISFGYE